MTWNLSRVPVTNINCHVAGAPVTRAPVTKSSTLPPLSRDPSSTAVPGAGHAGRAEGQGDWTSRCCGGGRLNRVGNRCVMGGFGTGEDTAELPWFGMSGQARHPSRLDRLTTRRAVLAHRQIRPSRAMRGVSPSRRHRRLHSFLRHTSHKKQLRSGTVYKRCCRAWTLQCERT